MKFHPRLSEVIYPSVLYHHPSYPPLSCSFSLPFPENLAPVLRLFLPLTDILLLIDMGIVCSISEFSYLSFIA
jgi:hypothetical protein